METVQVLLILLSVFKLATCWTCYSCNTESSNSEGCSDPFNSSIVNAYNCDAFYGISGTGCITAKYENEYGNLTYTTKDCAMYNRTTKITCDVAKTMAQEQKMNLLSCSTCNSDLCNSATVPSILSWILTGLVAAILGSFC